MTSLILDAVGIYYLPFGVCVRGCACMYVRLPAVIIE